MYSPPPAGDAIVADASFDDYSPAGELRRRGLGLVARVRAERAGGRAIEGRPDGDAIARRRPAGRVAWPVGGTAAAPEALTMRQASADARGGSNRAGQFEVVTTILGPPTGGGPSAGRTSEGGGGKSV